MRGGRLLVGLLSFLASATLLAGVADLSWTPPTQRTDGSPLTNLAGYRIYYGCAESRTYPNVIQVDDPGAIDYRVEDLPDAGTCYFAVSAVDTDGLESELSNEASKFMGQGGGDPPADPTSGPIITWKSQDYVMGYAASNQAETDQLVGSTTLSLELAVEVGQLVLIAVTKFAGTAASIQSVTANANAATFVRTVENTEDDRRQLHLYSWVSDVTDTIDIEVVFDVAQPFGMAAAAYDVGDPEIITHEGTSGSSSTPAHTVSSASGRIVASFLAVRGSPSATPDGGQDSRFTYNFFPEDGNYTWLALSDEAGDTSNTLSWTLGSSSQWNIITVQLAEPEPEPGPGAAVHTVGSVVTHGSTANSGSQNITVPSGAKLAVIFWSGAPSSGNWSMSSISLGGVAGVIRSNVAGVFPTVAAIGSATVENPPSGTQALAWDYTGSATAAVGSAFIVRFFTADGNIVVADWDAAAGDQGTTAQSLTVDSVSDGYVVGMAAGALDVNGAPVGSGQTLDLDNFSSNNLFADLSHVDSPGASTTTWNMTASQFASGAVVSLMEEPPPPEPPEPPTGLDVTSVSSSELSVTWDTEEGDLSYDVRFRRTDEFPTLTVQSSAPWHLERLSQRTRAETNEYLYGYTGAGVRIYVLDTGVRATHNQFGGRVIAGFNATDGPSSDEHGHGTQVASSAAGSASGTAKGATIVPVKVARTGTAEEVAADEDYATDYFEGLSWIADNHPSDVRGVVSSSVPLPVGADEEELEQAWQALLDKGLVCVQAAPNDGQEGFPDYSGGPPLPEGIIFVGGMREVDEFRPESNYGSFIDIIAPADSLTGLAGHTSDDATINSGGNSNAAPMVAGICAMILEENPHASVQRVTEILTQQANIGVLTSMPPNTVNALAYSLASSTDWVTHTDVGSPPYVIDSLEPDTEYEVQVRRTTAAGTSDWSSSALGTTAPETIELAVGDIAQLQALGAPTLTQTHALASGGLVQSQVFDAPTLTQTHELVSGGLVQGQAFDAPVLTQDHQLSPADLAQSQIFGAPGLTEDHQLAPGDIDQLQTFDAPTITQDHQLSPGGVDQLQVFDAPGLTEDHQLLPADLAQSQIFDAPDLTQDHQLSPGDVDQLQTFDAPGLTQDHQLGPGEIVQEQVFDSPTVSVESTLTPNDLAQLQAFDGLFITQDHQLTVADLVQVQALDAATLTQTHQLTVGDIVQLQVLDAPSLSQEATVSPQGLAQAQVIQAVAITQDQQLAVVDLVQLQAFDPAGLTQTHILSVSDIEQLQVIGGAAAGLSGYLVVKSIRFLPALIGALSIKPTN